MNLEEIRARAEACRRCGEAFDPADPAFNGRARYRDTTFCRSCTDRCHESTDLAHTCVICGGQAGDVGMNINEIRKRADKATPGPWRVVVDDSESATTVWRQCASPDHPADDTERLGVYDCCHDGGLHAEPFFREADAEFIAHARTDVEDLLDANNRLKGGRVVSAIFGHHKGAPRPFALYRRSDVTGVSGTGIVAEGAAFSDGTAVLRWLSDWPTSVVFHDRGMEAIEKVHGHGGATQVVWLSDELEPLAEMEQERDALRAEVERLNIALGACQTALNLHLDGCTEAEPSLVELLVLHDWDELVFGGFICLMCTPDEVMGPEENVTWPCPPLRAAGLTVERAEEIILRHYAELEAGVSGEAAQSKGSES